jgi:predicted NBD/HSP70 family sugar kinase
MDAVWECQAVPQPLEPAGTGSAATAGAPRQPVARAGRQLAAGAARQQSVREHNLGLVLGRVVDATAPVSRADVAAATGLTRSTVSSLVEVLVAADLVAEVGPERRAGAGAGRPGIGLVPSRRRVAGLGLELNVDYVAACVVDLAGEVRHREVVPRDLRGLAPVQAVGELASLARAAVDGAERDGLTLIGAAAALPGLVHAPDGLLRLAPNLGWHDVDVRGLLSREDALAPLAGRGALVVDNEANLAALGELDDARRRADVEGSRDSFLYVSGEIGVGAGIVLDGVIFRGSHGWGGEIGHLPVGPDGPACRCGSRGCLEQYAGREAILRSAGQESLADLVVAAADGQERALDALTESGRALGVAVSSVVNVVDVSTVVLGGLYAELAPWLTPAVEVEIAGRVLAHAWSPVTIRVCSLGGDAAILGAAGSVVRSVVEHPAELVRS